MSATGLGSCCKGFPVYRLLTSAKSLAFARFQAAFDSPDCLLVLCDNTLRTLDVGDGICLLLAQLRQHVFDAGDSFVFFVPNQRQGVVRVNPQPLADKGGELLSDFGGRVEPETPKLQIEPPPRQPQNSCGLRDVAARSVEGGLD